MQQLLEQLYNGEIYPNEQHKIRVNGYKEAKNVAFEAHEAFEEKLCQPMKEELDDFIGKQMEVSCLEDTQAFIDGFRLGAKLILEIVMEDKA